MRLVTDDERRARLGRRHGLAAPLRDVADVARALTCLHATEPASVHLAARARADVTLADVDAALYDDRSVVKQLAMRRTVFAFPRALLPAVWGSAAARVATQQQRRLVKEVEQTGIAADGALWVRTHLDAVLDLLHTQGPLGTGQIRAALPALDARLTRGAGTHYETDVAIARSVVVVLGAGGRILRGANAGGWKLSRPLWTPTGDWLGEDPGEQPEDDGYATLVEAWLGTFGPGTEADLVWWLGATKSAVRRALARVQAVEVRLQDGSVGFVLPTDVEEEPPVGPWAALLPALDPTTMGWKGRGFYLGEHAERLFDRNGNGGPTAWWNGRIVGGWTQRPDGQVVLVPAEELPPEAERALIDEARRLTGWLDGDVVRSIYQSPLVRSVEAAGT
ncbi:MAG TPA: winged helix DNA-binding domain-containing protein [Marmoricola sp.]|nr:winged helix DNA-binding domain-containing protein [Marmoricola sp.]